LALEAAGDFLTTILTTICPGSSLYGLPPSFRIAADLRK
jgi:hypothetical protein